MRTYRVVNLATSPHMGQAREFEVLSDETLARICGAIDDYNSWQGWEDTPTGSRYQRDSVSNVQSIIDATSSGLKNAAIWEIRKYCPGADAILDQVRKPGPETPPILPPSPTMVPSVDVPATLKPLTRPPVPTGQPRPGTVVSRPPVPSGQPGPGYTPPEVSPPVATGSEMEPTTIEETPTPPTPPPVETPSIGCWYVMGKGYMWGPRPSGGESTGLNQRDCENLIQRDIEVRTGQPQVTQQAACDPLRGQFFDPLTGQCRGSVSAAPGLPFGFPGPGTSAVGVEAGGMTAVTATMGRRRVALRGVNSNGNLEWWSYQQAFLPPLYFSRPRVNRATLGVGKPVPAGMCCQATEDGGAICSNGQGFPPLCPNKPEPNTPGIAERINQGGYLVPKPPPTPVDGVCAVAPSAGAPAKKDEAGGVPSLLGIGLVGAIVYALVEGLS